MIPETRAPRSVATERGAGHDQVRPTLPLTIGARNCVEALGVSWITARRFARAHGIPELRIAPRKVLIAAAPLLAALERQREQHDDGADELQRMRERVARAGAR